MSSRHASTEATSRASLTAAAAPGTRRTSARTSPGRSNVLLGMHAQYEHSPPTSSASTTAMDAPHSWQRPAMFSPADPPPSTITSNFSIRSVSPPTRGQHSVSGENDGMTTVLGIDIGGTGIKGAPVDTRSGRLLADRHRILTPHPATPDAVTEVVGELAK